VTTRFYIEDSRTPIFRRISRALGLNLAGLGHEVMVVRPEGFGDVASFRQFVATRNDGVYPANSRNAAIETPLPESDGYLFESFPGPLVFLHQDAILGGAGIVESLAKLQAWKRVAARSVHLCLEPDSARDLQALSIGNCFIVPHATEIAAAPPLEDGFATEASFVGHLVPEHYRPVADDARVQGFVEAAIERRIADFGWLVEPAIQDFLGDSLSGLGTLSERPMLKVALFQWMRTQVTMNSLPLRGRVLARAAVRPLTVIGGDPAYMSGVQRDLRLATEGITYLPPVFEVDALSDIYRNSRVSINITSLQFDHAVVNRFHDVVMSGGLCLTDWRPGLEELTTLHGEVSFRTVDELRDKARHFVAPANASSRAALVRALQADVARHSGYPAITSALVAGLAAL
jgi:hypothetical protein